MLSISLFSFARLWTMVLRASNWDECKFWIITLKRLNAFILFQEAMLIVLDQTGLRKVDLIKPVMAALSICWGQFNLVDAIPNPLKEQLVDVAQRHFMLQVLAKLVAVPIFVYLQSNGGVAGHFGVCSGCELIEDCPNDLERNGEIFEFGCLC
ncbi:hypothetical protein FH972_010784 [Carpinus fangiana]|uniref:Uncharacterized protein n=1 Tax=Carpinus fangiana TaxID=176857 RepID=A0A660KWB3_9ROSI|nr:hypothetical protein FH972_010784 [Carpinus fangiana]